MENANTMDNAKMTNGPITRILLSFAGPVLFRSVTAAAL